MCCYGDKDEELFERKGLVVWASEEEVFITFADGACDEGNETGVGDVESKVY